MDWSADNSPSLVVRAVGLALNDNLFCFRNESQEDVDVYIVVCQVADIDLRRTGLRHVIPKNVTVTGVSRRGACICPVQK
jgi:hypothetical protein